MGQGKKFQVILIVVFMVSLNFNIMVLTFPYFRFQQCPFREATDYVADSVLTSRTVVNHYKERSMPLESSDRPIKGAPFKLKQEVLVAAHAFLTEIEKNRAMVEGFNIKSKFVSISFVKRDGRSNRETLRLSRSSALMLTGERTQEPVYYLRQEKPTGKIVQL
jgi:hypothetical protein